MHGHWQWPFLSRMHLNSKTLIHVHNPYDTYLYSQLIFHLVVRGKTRNIDWQQIKTSLEDCSDLRLWRKFLKCLLGVVNNVYNKGLYRIRRQWKRILVAFNISSFRLLVLVLLYWVWFGIWLFLLHLWILVYFTLAFSHSIVEIALSEHNICMQDARKRISLASLPSVMSLTPHSMCNQITSRAWKYIGWTENLNFLGHSDMSLVQTNTHMCAAVCPYIIYDGRKSIRQAVKSEDIFIYA